MSQYEIFKDKLAKTPIDVILAGVTLSKTWVPLIKFEFCLPAELKSPDADEMDQDVVLEILAEHIKQQFMITARNMKK